MCVCVCVCVSVYWLSLKEDLFQLLAASFPRSPNHYSQNSFLLKILLLLIASQSSHVYLVIMLVEGLKLFMFCSCFSLSEQIQSCFQNSKWQCLPLMRLHQHLSSAPPHHDLLFYSNIFFLSLLSAKAISTSETFLIYHFMDDSSTSLTLSKSYPCVGREMVSQNVHIRMYRGSAWHIHQIERNDAGHMFIMDA